MGNNGQYKCGEPGCKGHHNFGETCSTIIHENKGYPALDQFIKGEWMGLDDQPDGIQIADVSEQDTQPYKPGPGLVDAPLDTEAGYKKKADLGKSKEAKIR